MVANLVGYLVLALYPLYFTLETVTGNPKVWLTVSSVIDKVKKDGIKAIEQRKLELNWIDLPTAGDVHWVGLFDREVKGAATPEEALVAIHPKTISKGRYKTTVEFPVHQFSPSNLTSNCLGFWIYAVSGNMVVAGNCIRGRPFWMKESLRFIQSKPLRELMIPGAHNAGSYEVGFKAGSGSRLKKYVICHDENVFNQLAYGNRYLDLRVSYEAVKGRSEMLWIVHGILRVDVPLEDVLHQIKDFMDATEKEVVIVDFHRFEKGFDPKVDGIDEVRERHFQVFTLIEHYLKSHMALNTNGYYVKFGDLLKSGKRLVLGYSGHRFIRDRHLYPRVRHLWAEADNITNLEKFFEETICHSYSFEATSAMAQLTPTTWGVVFDKYGGLRKMAQDVNWIMTQWFRDRWWRCANIVSSDFFLGNNLIQVAIQSNKRRALESRSKRSVWADLISE